jgi:hypothetical protein
MFISNINYLDMINITRKLIFSVINLLFITTIFSQEGRRIDLEEYYYKDPILFELIKTDSILYNYDNGGTQYTSSMTYNRPIGTTIWNEFLQTIRVYDINDKLMSEEEHFYNGATYTPLRKDEWTYNSDGNNDTIYFRTYVDPDFLNSRRIVISYNPDDTESQRREDNWNVINMEYDYYALTNSTYTNGLLTKIDGFTYNGMNLEDSYRVNITNTVFGAPDATLTEEYDGVNWVNLAFVDYEYNGELPDYTLQQDWDTNLEPDNWVNAFKVNFAYDENDVINEVLGQAWDRDVAGGGAFPFWYDIYKLVIHTTNILNTSTQTIKTGKAYPNPFNSELTVSLKSALEGEGTLQMLDIHGKEISNIELRQGVKSIQINNPYLSKGLYFIQITSGEERSVFKVIKQ